MKSQLSILLVDDHPLIGRALEKAFIREGYSWLQSCGRLTEAEERLKYHDVDILLLDVHLPDGSGLDFIGSALALKKNLKIMILSSLCRGYHIQKALAAGAYGYLSKYADIGEILEGIQNVIIGEKYLCKRSMKSMIEQHTELSSEADSTESPALTPREIEILNLIVAGKSNPKIASDLFISPLTVDSHRKKILQKLGVNNTAQMVVKAIRLDLVS